MQTLDLTVPPESAGQRVDRWLARARTGLSRNRIQALIDAGRVHVDGKAARASLRLKGGQRVFVEIPPRRPPRLVPEPRPITIVHEDEHVIVVDKPAGWIVHPGAGAASGTLVHALLHHAPEVAGVGGEGRPGIVHRLDKDTSGLLVVARTEQAYLALVEMLRTRAVTRIYRALVWGSPGPDSGVVDRPVGRDPRDRKRMAIVPEGAGKPARTRWRVIERFGVATFVECRLDTGRTHQIRVHLASLRLPVVGDPVYGGRARKSLSLRQAERSLGGALLRVLPRQALHATRLEFRHPVSGEPLRFESPLPEDFARALQLLEPLRASRP